MTGGDPRLRLVAALALASASILVRSPIVHVCLLAAFAALAWRSGVRVVRLLGALVLFGAVTTLANALLAPGPRLTPVALPWLSLSGPGLLAGLRAAARLAELSLLGAALARVTTADQVTDVASMLFAPVRRVPGLAGLDVTIGLAAASVPLVAEEARDARLALRFRGPADRPSRLPPLAEARAVAAPLVVGTLRRAETLARAMAARGYDPTRRRTRLPAYRATPSDVALTLGVLAAAFAIVAVDRALRGS